MITTNKDWKIVIEQDPNRNIAVYDQKTKELIEVHDKENGNIWFRIDNDRWGLI